MKILYYEYKIFNEDCLVFILNGNYLYTFEFDAIVASDITGNKVEQDFKFKIPANKKDEILLKAGNINILIIDSSNNKVYSYKKGEGYYLFKERLYFSYEVYKCSEYLFIKHGKYIFKDLIHNKISISNEKYLVIEKHGKYHIKEEDAYLISDYTGIVLSRTNDILRINKEKINDIIKELNTNNIGVIIKDGDNSILYDVENNTYSSITNIYRTIGIVRKEFKKYF